MGWLVGWLVEMAGGEWQMAGSSCGARGAQAVAHRVLFEQRLL